MQRKFNELEQLRRKKLVEYQKKGINPYSRDVVFEDTSKTLFSKYNNFSKEELNEKKKKSSIIFRIMTIRGPFLVGNDSFGQVQSYVGKNLPSEVLDLKNSLDLGDIIKVVGEVMKTGTGQITIRCEKLFLITKSLKPLPEQFYGLKDVEERYRKRYLDLLINGQVKEIFLTRTKIISGIREFFNGLNYMEVDTPILSATLGGAAAKPFITHHNALNMQFYLRVATELALKKLLVGGIERVYEIGRLFRNEGIDTTHNPEFTTIEFYEAYSNLEGMMKRTEEIIMFLAKKLNKNSFEHNGKTIFLKTPFKKIEMVDSVSEVVGTNMKKVTLEEAKKIAKNYKIKIEPYFEIGHIINALFELLVEKTLIQPTFVYGHPIEISPLAVANENDNRFADRAELFIIGQEYGNMFTELNDPIEQLKRFQNQLEELKNGNDEANEIDWSFVEALEYGMPPAGGCGIGIDRLIMFFTEQQSIREVLLFPHLKNKNKVNNE